jgi:hypothetical protein
MKKEVKRFEIGWRLYSLIIGAVFLLVFASLTFAYGGSSPSGMGHSGNELEVVYNGATTTLNTAISTIQSSIANVISTVSSQNTKITQLESKMSSNEPSMHISVSTASGTKFPSSDYWHHYYYTSIPDSSLEEYCGDSDGCKIVVGYSDNSNTFPTSEFSASKVFFYKKIGGVYKYSIYSLSDTSSRVSIGGTGGSGASASAALPWAINGVSESSVIFYEKTLGNSASSCRGVQLEATCYVTTKASSSEFSGASGSLVLVGLLGNCAYSPYSPVLGNCEFYVYD